MNNIGKNLSSKVIKLEQPKSTSVSKQSSDLGFVRDFNITNGNSVSGIGMANIHETTIGETFNRMSSDYNYLKSNILDKQEEAINPEDYKTIFYDSTSGVTFEIMPIEGAGFIIDKENFDKFCDLYPVGTEIHRFKMAEMRGDAKIVNGVPVWKMECFPNGYEVKVYDENFNEVRSYHIDGAVGKLDSDMFFDKLEDFEKTNNIESTDFWDKFISEL